MAHSSRPLIRVLNTTSDTKVIPNVISHTENLSDFDIYTLESTDGKKEKNRKLLNIIEKNTPKYAKKSVLSLCDQFADVFALDDDRMTVNNFYEQSLRLNDKTPVYIKNYRLPKAQKAEIDRQVKKLLDNKLIEPSRSSYNSPIILVPKKSVNGEKKWRMCVDYRMVNKRLVADKYPFPRIDDILDSLGRAKYFSILDLYSGFHQVGIEKDSRDITSFSTDKGSYCWKVLPFGLDVSPNSFSRMLTIAFAGLPPEQAFLYMDDIIVIGCSENHHMSNLKQIFETCRKYN